MEYQFTSSCAEDTLHFAKQLASHLQPKDIVVLTGELGSGKTKFVEGVLSYFGLETMISSPTFTIVNQYDTANFPIFHFDVYRLQDADSFYEIGGEEYFEKGLCLIEWGEIIQEALPREYIHIFFEKEASHEKIRTLNIKTVGERFSHYFERMIIK